MKLVNCAYSGCSDRRAHWERPFEKRPHQRIEVPDHYIGKAYCSLECAVYDKHKSIVEVLDEKV